MMNMIPYYAARPFRSRTLLAGDEFFRSFFSDNAPLAMHVDVEDKGESYLLQADLPGMKREDVRISVEDGVLTIAAEYAQDNTKEDKERRYVLRERHSGSMSRSFRLEGINQEGIHAEYTDGVLRLTLPKEEERSGARRIEIA